MNKFGRVAFDGVDSSASSNNLPSVCFISALTVADFIDPELITQAHAQTGAQVGVLTLAAILRERGYDPQVINLDDLFYEFIQQDPLCRENNSTRPGLSEFFFPFVLRRLDVVSFDVVGLSSICSSYPLTLRLAQEVRRLNPQARIILGGPQASVVDIATLKAFECVDLIVRGEADDTLPKLLPLLGANQSDWENIPGISFRRGGEVVRNPNAAVVENLDRLPLPAFDLDTKIKERGGIHIEIGRGCPFACTFCSTNDFFRRNFRLKSPARMVSDIASLKKQYGLGYFSLVHDMYTIDRRKVVEFCDHIRASEVEFTWGCSARTDCIDDDLLESMAKAGCTGIFFGIETGSQRLQHVIHKNLDLVEAWQRIAAADRNAIQTTVALIVGFPEETRSDLRDTIHFFIDALRFDHAEPQCSLLAPLAATPIYERHKHELIFDEIFSDMSHQSWRQDPVETEMIKAYPDVFPNFYAVPTVEVDRRYAKEVLDFVTYLATWFRWLPVALLQDSGDLLSVFDRWRLWLQTRIPTDQDEELGWTPYYSHRRFRNEFLEFVEGCYLKEMTLAPAAISALLAVEGTTGIDAPPQPVNEVDYLDEELIPYRSDTFIVADINVNYDRLISAVRNKTSLSHVPLEDTTIVFRPRGEKEVDVWQLPALSVLLLRMCDGVRTVAEITKVFSDLRIEVGKIPIEKVCWFGLSQLREDGLIKLSSTGRADQHEASQPKDNSLYSLPPKVTNTQQPWPPKSVREIKTG